MVMHTSWPLIYMTPCSCEVFSKVLVCKIDEVSCTGFCIARNWNLHRPTGLCTLAKCWEFMVGWTCG